MPENLREAFKEEVCSACGYCGDSLTEPHFCMIIYSGNKDRFLNIVQYLIHLRKHDRRKFKTLDTFESFCGIWCNSKPACPNKSAKCANLDQRISCFSIFATQDNSIVDKEVRAGIYEAFSGIELDKIGKKYSINASIKKDVRKAIKGLKKKLAALAGECYTSTKALFTPKEATTAVFYRDNPKWIERIEKILGESLTKKDDNDDNNETEADNRQPANAE